MEHNYTQTQTHSKYSENGKLQANQYYQHQSSKQQPIAKTKKKIQTNFKDVLCYFMNFRIGQTAR